MRIALCPAADVPAGTVLRVADVAGLEEPVALVNVDGELYCIDDRCSHQDASLSDGWLDGHCLECPLHDSRFDLRTGEPDGPPAKAPVRTHRVEVADATVYLVREG